MRTAAPKSENKLGTGKVAVKTISSTENDRDKRQEAGDSLHLQEDRVAGGKAREEERGKEVFSRSRQRHILQGLEGHDKEFHLILFTRAAVGGSQAKE